MNTCLKRKKYFVPKSQLTGQSLINVTCLKRTKILIPKVSALDRFHYSLHFTDWNLEFKGQFLIVIDNPAKYFHVTISRKKAVLAFLDLPDPWYTDQTSYANFCVQNPCVAVHQYTTQFAFRSMQILPLNHQISGSKFMLEMLQNMASDSTTA